jgi:carotenoid cleavage dioxygenase-like enzyme
MSFCFHFSDVVKVLEDGDLQTLGLLDYDKRLKHSFTAHPKVDPFTGTLVRTYYVFFLFEESEHTISYFHLGKLG